jgi:hypothetical protein
MEMTFTRFSNLSMSNLVRPNYRTSQIDYLFRDYKQKLPDIIHKDV